MEIWQVKMPQSLLLARFQCFSFKIFLNVLDFKPSTSASQIWPRGYWFATSVLCHLNAETFIEKERVKSKSIFLSQLMTHVKVDQAQQQAAGGMTPNRDFEGITWPYLSVGRPLWQQSQFCSSRERPWGVQALVQVKGGKDMIQGTSQEDEQHRLKASSKAVAFTHLFFVCLFLHIPQEFWKWYTFQRWHLNYFILNFYNGKGYNLHIIHTDKLKQKYYNTPFKCIW